MNIVSLGKFSVFIKIEIELKEEINLSLVFEKEEYKRKEICWRKDRRVNVLGWVCYRSLNF